jgi:hypothetical protein
MARFKMPFHIWLEWPKIPIKDRKSLDTEPKIGSSRTRKGSSSHSTATFGYTVLLVWAW